MSRKSFLSKFAEPDRHYSYDESPLGYLENAKNIPRKTLKHALVDSERSDLIRAASSNPDAHREDLEDAVLKHNTVFPIRHEHQASEAIDKAYIRERNIPGRHTMSDAGFKELLSLDERHPARQRHLRQGNLTDSQVKHIVHHGTYADKSSLRENDSLHVKHTKLLDNNGIAPTENMVYHAFTSGSPKTFKNKPLFPIHRYLSRHDTISDEDADKMSKLSSGLSLDHKGVHSLFKHALTSDKFARLLANADHNKSSWVQNYHRDDLGADTILIKHRALKSEHIKNIALRAMENRGSDGRMLAIEALHDNRLKQEHAKEIVDAALSEPSRWNRQVENTYKRKFSVEEATQTELLFNRPENKSVLKLANDILKETHGTTPRAGGVGKIMWTHDLRGQQFNMQEMTEKLHPLGFTTSYLSGSLAKLRHSGLNKELILHHHPLGNGKAGFLDVRSDVPESLRSIVR